MENAPCVPPKNKVGRPRKAFDDLTPSSKRARRSRDPNKCNVLTIVEAQPRTPTEPAKRGRPLLPYEELSAEGRRTRDYRAGLVDKHLPLQLLPMLAAADVLVAQDAVQQDAECLRDEVARRVHALERQLGMRNPSANGPAALMLRAAVRVEGDADCLLCCSSDVLVQSMRCCGNACCAPCLGKWLRRNGEMVPVGYGAGDYYLGVDEECGMPAPATYSEACRSARGRVIRVRMNTHRCPWCNAPVDSVRRGIV